MYFKYTFFFVQVFFIINTHASNGCISCTLDFSCKCFSSSIHMLLMHVFHVYSLFRASVFCRQLTCIHMLLMHVFFAHLLFMQVFFVVSWRAYTCFSCMYFLLSVDRRTHLYGENFVWRVKLEKKRRTSGILSFISSLFWMGMILIHSWTILEK